jgi:hypothetical protein
MEDDPLDSPRWIARTDFAPGFPTDPDAIPTVHYQALHGVVYTLTRWKDGSTARGEVPLSDLEALAGAGLREGWYDATGAFLGTTVDLD